MTDWHRSRSTFEALIVRITSPAKWHEWLDRFARFERQGGPDSVVLEGRWREAMDVLVSATERRRRIATLRPKLAAKAEAGLTPVDVIETPPAAGVVIRMPHSAWVELARESLCSPYREVLAAFFYETLAQAA